jgi:hypothetical protein
LERCVATAKKKNTTSGRKTFQESSPQEIYDPHFSYPHILDCHQFHEGKNLAGHPILFVDQA